tara:strand:+ start:173 stop:391 length:219 start_codon:yes stop_codon:yes gene_type:complete
MKANKNRNKKLFEIGQLAICREPISGAVLVLDVDWEQKDTSYMYWCLHQRTGEKFWLLNDHLQPIEETGEKE